MAYPDGLNVIASVLMKWKQKGQVKRRWKRRAVGYEMLAADIEEVGRDITKESWKRQGNDFPLGPLEGVWPCATLVLV